MARKEPESKRASARRGGRNKVTGPKRLRGKVCPKREESGPRGWFLEQIEASYLRLSAAAAPTPEPFAADVRLPRGRAFRSRLRPGEGEAALTDLRKRAWIDRLRAYKERKAAANVTVRPTALASPAPTVPGGRNWLPLGPTVVRGGQTVGEQPVAGRVSGLALAREARVVYAATACGGVFRSDDGGASWRSLMDGFDLDPTSFASASLACGAIAIDLADPERIYIGTGEGDTHQLFSSRIVNALPAYRGVGPIRSDDGGTTWESELTAPVDPELAGEAFFALAVDPVDRERVVGATTAGLYVRIRDSNDMPLWHRRRPNVHSSVVTAHSAAGTRFFAAEWGIGVFQSADGDSWTPAGHGFPANDVGRIALAVTPGNTDLVYAFVINGSGAIHGIYRLDGSVNAWQRIAGPPDVIPTMNGLGQGDYDLAIAIDPADPNLIYLGGSYVDSPPFGGSVWRCRVNATSDGLAFADKASIGTHAHADIHFLSHTPDEPDELWCGCDGGVFLNRAPRSTGTFAGINESLSCLCSNFITQHPTDPGILLSGLQDNGTAHTGGSPSWSHVNYGDGGYCLINWANPDRVLSFANGTVFRSITGGTSHSGWVKVWDFGWATMTQPIVSPPHDPTNPEHASWVAVGAGSQVYVSKDFAGRWPMRFTIPGGSAAGSVFALAFPSTTHIFVGTTTGRVFRADRTGSSWVVARLDDAQGGPLGVIGLVSDVAIDPADTTASSIYVAFGGMGDPRHVWMFNGMSWQARSGTGRADSLIDVEHNALAIDASAPANIYVGADIGVWHSADAGATWAPFQNGLPDAPVFDLQIHPTQRLLRAATHGRGVYEIALAQTVKGRPN